MIHFKDEPTGSLRSYSKEIKGEKQQEKLTADEECLPKHGSGLRALNRYPKKVADQSLKRQLSVRGKRGRNGKALGTN